MGVYPAIVAVWIYSLKYYYLLPNFRNLFHINNQVSVHRNTNSLKDIYSTLAKNSSIPLCTPPITWLCRSGRVYFFTPWNWTGCVTWIGQQDINNRVVSRGLKSTCNLVLVVSPWAHCVKKPRPLQGECPRGEGPQSLLLCQRLKVPQGNGSLKTSFISSYEVLGGLLHSES